MSIKVRMGQQKKIALVAHDKRKKDLLDWVKRNREVLGTHFLFGTGTTGTMISGETNLPVATFKSGPLGGDQQIGSRIIEGDIDFIVFFWDPLEAQPHDPDVKALLRIAVLYDIPCAMNIATADFLFTSELMKEEYEREIIDYGNRIRREF
ncbi:methylglyoxal synthase [Vallitalea okinawensis]|uniref:methylglyoxal synthase n=1 Tax=Vallitalea okinawensis TaxID=2078660 RepID=UPI000CFD37F9|nr:methylglyoxal synthase [Vallitalea okinawensis]